MSKSPKLDPQESTGRIAHDDRGNAIWEWRTETGTYKADIDTQQVRALQDATDVKLGGTAVPPPGTSSANHNPYSTADRPTSTSKPPRRSLDDMRKLSEEIKRAREGKKG